MVVVAIEFFVLIADEQYRLAYERTILSSFKEAVTFKEFQDFSARWKLSRRSGPRLHFERQVTASCVEVRGTVYGTENKNFQTRVLVDQECGQYGIAALMMRDTTNNSLFMLPASGFRLADRG